MTKLLVIPNNKDITKLKPFVDTFLFGLEGYSVNTCNITLEEIKKLKDVKLFISLNKNMKNDDIEPLKEILKELDKLNLEGIFYADTCFINLKKELGLKTPLVWSNEHLVTNYATINFWNQYGADYAYLAGEITLEEIKEIAKNSQAKLIVPAFGHLPVYVSLRHAVKNYLKTFNLEDNSKINYLQKENNLYPIVDNELGTCVYSNYILDAYDELKDLDVEYISLNAFNLNEDEFIEILKKYNNLDYQSNLETSKGFMYEETIYRVKK